MSARVHYEVMKIVISDWERIVKGNISMKAKEKSVFEIFLLSPSFVKNSYWYLQKLLLNRTRVVGKCFT